LAILETRKVKKKVRSEASEKTLVEKRKKMLGPAFFHAIGWGFVELEGHDLAHRSCCQNAIPFFRTRARGAHQGNTPGVTSVHLSRTTLRSTEFRVFNLLKL
jgi:hypothetical protein